MWSSASVLHLFCGNGSEFMTAPLLAQLPFLPFFCSWFLFFVFRMFRSLLVHMLRSSPAQQLLNRSSRPDCAKDP